MELLQQTSKTLIQGINEPIQKIEIELKQAKLKWQETKRELTKKISEQKEKLGCRTRTDTKLLKFLSQCNADDLFILPYEIFSKVASNHQENCTCTIIANIFCWYRKLLDNNDPNHNTEVIKSILAYEQYFDTGTTEMKVHVEGLRRGYKGRDTYFDKVTDAEIERMCPAALDEEHDYKCAMAKENFYFYTMEDCWEYDEFGDDIDWGDWDSEYASSWFEMEMIWIRRKKDTSQ